MTESIKQPWRKRHWYFVHKTAYFVVLTVVVVGLSFNAGMFAQFPAEVILFGSSLIGLMLLGAIHVASMLTVRLLVWRKQRDAERVRRLFC